METQMFLSKKLIVLIILISLNLKQTNSNCDICVHCISCPSDISSDNYLDIIDNLLRQKFKGLEYPININKMAVNKTNLNYKIVYSNNVTLNINLDT
jgi:predicted aldo/keto reductase-like oxidoreductase